MSEEIVDLPLGAYRKALIRFIILFFAVLIPAIVLIKLAIIHRATLSPCASAPWTFGLNLVPVFPGVIGALMVTRHAYRLIRTGQMPLPAAGLPLDDKRIKTGRRVYIYAGTLLVMASLIVFIVGLTTGLFLASFLQSEIVECVAK